MKDKHDNSTVDWIESIACEPPSDTSLAPEQSVSDEPQLLRNAIQTPDGSVLESRHRYDYVEHVDKVNGKEYMVDAGLDYIRRSNHGDEVDLSLWSDMPHEKLRQEVTWGSYGRNGDEPLHYIPIGDMTTEHIENVLKNVPNIYPAMKQVMIDELDWRKGKAAIM